MVGLLLAIIYLAFISLGLPDSMLGSAWPSMVPELSVPLSYAGILSMIISAGTILSSLFSDALTKRWGAGLVTAVSVGLTALGLLGFSIGGEFWVLCILAIPYGLGAGAVDAALNNYVAIHFASRHMNWLHCFWGVGATIGPYIMGLAIGADLGWRSGYGVVGILQILLTAVLFLSLPLWKKNPSPAAEGEAKPSVGIAGAVRIPGVKAVLLAFFGYCAFESTAGLWASSYLVEYRAVDADTAASFASLFYLGITGGRFLCGFISDLLGDKRMIRMGIGIMILGICMIALPFHSVLPALIGLVVFGVGAAPVYPAVIHATPLHFGKENSQAIVGIQMASAYCGSTLAPPVFGLIAQHIHIAIYPYYLGFFLLLLLLMTERVNKVCNA